MHTLLIVLLGLAVLGLVYFRDWMIHGKGGSKVDSWWIRRKARRAGRRT
ncbi:hypothetical protein ACIQCJ_05070 [Streptomyces sp. NPDC093221]